MMFSVFAWAHRVDRLVKSLVSAVGVSYLSRDEGWSAEGAL